MVIDGLRTSSSQSKSGKRNRVGTCSYRFTAGNYGYRQNEQAHRQRPREKTSTEPHPAHENRQTKNPVNNRWRTSQVGYIDFNDRTNTSRAGVFLQVNGSADTHRYRDNSDKRN